MKQLKKTNHKIINKFNLEKIDSKKFYNLSKEF